MSRIERLLTRKNELAEMYRLLSGKINELQRAHVLETSVAEKLKLESEIARYERERGDIEKELKAIEEIGDAEEEASVLGRIEWGIEIIIEKLQKGEQERARLAEKVDCVMRELGIRCV